MSLNVGATEGEGTEGVQTQTEEAGQRRKDVLSLCTQWHAFALLLFLFAFALHPLLSVDRPFIDQSS